MLNTKTLLAMLLLNLSPTLIADDISDDEMKKALEGIIQIKVMESAEPKIISEVSIKSLPTKKKIVKHKKKKVHKKKVHKKKVYKKKVYKKKVHKKRVHKKHKTDFSDLPIAKTLGVIETSKVFTGKY